MIFFKRTRFFIGCLLLTICFCLGGSMDIAAQTAPPYNRFQYHNYKWKVLRTPLFQLYFPGGYDSLASLASVQLPDIIAEVKKVTATDVKNVPNLIIYPSLDQLYESNIGMHQQEIQTFPTVNLKGDRVMLAFDGSYAHFRSRLKAAWVMVCWEEQFKNDLEEQLNNQRSFVPRWFKEGCIRYWAYGWEIADEDKLQQLIHTDTVNNWETLSSKDAALSGQAFCYFLVHRYRDDAVMQCFFQMKQGKSLARAVRLITKHRLDSLTNECIRYYKARTNNNTLNNNTSNSNHLSLDKDTLQSLLEARYKGKLFSMDYNSDHSVAVFVMQRNNRRDLFIAKVKDLNDPEFKAKAFSYYLMPPWLEEHDADRYPVLQWQQNGHAITSIQPEKGKLKIFSFNLQGNPLTQRTMYGMDGVDAFTPWNASQYLLSAYRRGRSDIVGYDINTLRYTPLTTDYADHTALMVSRGSAKPLIIYRSGYPADSLYHTDSVVKDYGIYTKEISNDFKEAAKQQDILIAKDSAYIQWYRPFVSDGNALSLEGTASGYLEHVPVNQVLLSYNEKDAKFKSPWLRDYLRDLKTKDSISKLLTRNSDAAPSFLQGVLHTGDTKQAAQLQKDSLRRNVAYSDKKLSPYILQLHSAYFSASVNNDYFINRYQPYQAYLGTFKFPEVGAMVTGGFSDLFENHQFNIGYRLPAGTEGSDFFVRYENAAKKTDWHLLFFRKVESLEPDPQRDWKDPQGNPYPFAAKVKTHYYELGFHTPLHYDWSLDYSLAARRDVTIFLSTDKYSLDYDNLQSWWGIGNVAFKVHKMRPTIPLLERGWEGKLLLDGMASTGKQSTVVYGAQFNFSYSRPIVKDITIVARLQAGYSGGQSKILYNFGGQDNNIVTRLDTAVHFSQDAPFAFQTLVTPFRGYVQNSIYGSRYGLLNLDLYFPLFRSLIPLQTSISSLKNFQVGLFTDFAKTQGATGLPAVKSQLHSFGFSVRTMLAGYPMRFDMAWPGSFDKSPVWYLSLALK